MVTGKKEFIENDVIGEATLDVISRADHFNNWMYQTIKPFCRGKVMEIGCGIGQMSGFFLRDNFEIALADIRKGYCKRVRETFSNFPNLLGVELMDLVDPDFDKKFSKYFDHFDTVYSLNVVEHIHADILALKNANKLLKKGGRLIILVPSYQWLYNGMDQELAHYRRYTISSLSKVFQAADFQVIHQQYFNFIGILGWFVNGKILGNKMVTNGQMDLYNLLVPAIKLVDKIIFNSAGLSTIVVGEKQD